MATPESNGWVVKSFSGQYAYTSICVKDEAEALELVDRILAKDETVIYDRWYEMMTSRTRGCRE